MDLAIIGSRLVSLRKAKGISQIKLAELTKLDRTYISRIEHGKQNMTMTTLIFICDCLGVTLKEFFDFDDGDISMSKYDSLHEYLVNCDDSVTLTFDGIEKILGFKLPKSARSYQAWWANAESDKEYHPYCRSWQDVGFKTTNLDLKNETVTFEKVK